MAYWLYGGTGTTTRSISAFGISSSNKYTESWSNDDCIGGTFSGYNNVTMTYGSNNRKIYVNGTAVSVTGGTPGDSHIFNGSNCTISSPDYPLNSQVYNLSIFSNVLDSKYQSIVESQTGDGISLYPITYPFAFTNAGISGPNGPTLANIRTAYSSYQWTQYSSNLNMTTQGIQLWTIPTSGTYNIIAAGARGGRARNFASNAGGYGVIVSASIKLVRGDIVKILVGQIGGSVSNVAGGGGGGTFVTTSTNVPLLIAGGGGGGAINYNLGNYDPNTMPSIHGVVTTSGIGPNGAGGIRGNGGVHGWADFGLGNGGGGAGGLYGNAISNKYTFGSDSAGDPYPSNSFTNGGTTYAAGNGGFGCGGYGAFGDEGGGGGGGGYSGGGGGYGSGVGYAGQYINGYGGGGGSCNMGGDANQYISNITVNNVLYSNGYSNSNGFVLVSLLY